MGSIINVCYLVCGIPCSSVESSSVSSSRCICPSTTYGAHCKVLYRNFNSRRITLTNYFEPKHTEHRTTETLFQINSTKRNSIPEVSYSTSSSSSFTSSWEHQSSILLPNLPSCSHLHISLWFLSSHGSGSLISWGNAHEQVSVQLLHNNLEMIVKTASTNLHNTASINGLHLDDKNWHRLDFWWKNRVSITCELEFPTTHSYIILFFFL